LADIVVSDSAEVEASWLIVRNEVLSDVTGFDRLGLLQKRYALAEKLYTAASLSEGKRPDGRDLIEYEALTSRIPRLPDAYASESRRILALEKESQWGQLRAFAEQVVSAGALRLDPTNLRTARQAISNWKSAKKKLANAEAIAGGSART